MPLVKTRPKGNLNLVQCNAHFEPAMMEKFNKIVEEFGLNRTYTAQQLILRHKVKEFGGSEDDKIKKPKINRDEIFHFYMPESVDEKLSLIRESFGGVTRSAAMRELVFRYRLKSKKDFV